MQGTQTIYIELERTFISLAEDYIKKLDTIAHTSSDLEETDFTFSHAADVQLRAHLGIVLGKKLKLGKDEVESLLKKIEVNADDFVVWYDREFSIDDFCALAQKYDLKFLQTSTNLLEVFVARVLMRARYGVEQDVFGFEAPLITSSPDSTFLVVTSCENVRSFPIPAESYKKYNMVVISSISLDLEHRQQYLKEAIAHNAKNVIRNLVQLDGKLQVLQRVKAEPELESQLFNIGYKCYKGKRIIKRNDIFYDEFPFIYNVVGYLEGETRDFDVCWHKHKQIGELKRSLELIQQERKEGKGFEDRTLFMNTIEAEFIVRDRLKSMTTLRTIAKQWSGEDAAKGIHVAPAEDVTVLSDYTQAVRFPSLFLWQFLNNFYRPFDHTHPK